MKTIYCISGLGADERAFSKLAIEGYQLKVIRWITPKKEESIEEYATRMRGFIEEENPILMGLSFGGIMSIEISKQVPVKKIILISSIKNRSELPFWLKTIGQLKINKLHSMRSSRITEPLQNHFLGAETAADKQLARTYRKEADLAYTKWAVNCIVNWKGDGASVPLYHIHGSRDRMFPLRYVKPDYIVKNGGHFMIMNRADEVNTAIHSFLRT